MFICKLCNEELTSKGEIVGTYCGHVFHQICMDLHLNKSAVCPTCKKSLKVNMALLATLSHNNAIMPLRLEECHSSRQRMVNENILLRQKVVELAKTIIMLQDERKASQMQQILSDETCSSRNNSQLANIISRTREPSTSSKAATRKMAVLSESVSQERNVPPSSSFSKNEKDKVLRSKRREYLTWRNKAQTWVSKMEKASDKLLGAEACFTQQEFHQQLVLLYNKLSIEGEIIETTKKASVIYLVIGDISETEKEAIQNNIQYLTSLYEEIIMKIINRLTKSRSTLEPSKMTYVYRRVLHSGESRAWIETDVSQSPKFYKTDSCPTIQLMDDGAFREPIFV